MALFGTGHPQLYINGTLMADLQHAVVERCEPNTNYTTHESKLDGVRDFIPRGTHLDIAFVLHLFKYSQSDRVGAFMMVSGLKGQKVSVKLYHSAPSVYKRPDGRDALFIVKEVTPFYLETANYTDAVRIELTSCHPVDLAQNISEANVKAPVYIATEANIDLSNNTNINNGVGGMLEESEGEHILVRSQTNSTENGLYLIPARHGQFTRIDEADTWESLIGAVVYVMTGLRANTRWLCDASSGGTLGTTGIHWTQI